MTTGLHIALVTPFAWSIPSAVNQHVADLACELKARGHLPVVVVSSDDPRGRAADAGALPPQPAARWSDLLQDYRAGGGTRPSCSCPSPGSGPLEADERHPRDPDGAQSSPSGSTGRSPISDFPWTSPRAWRS